MDKIVILGSEGMLGGALMKQFAESYQVIGLDRKDIDVTDPKNVEQKLRELQPVAVVNAAAYNNVDEVEKNEDSYATAKKINGEAVGNLAAITKELGIPLVHFSSDYVFAGKDLAGYNETSSTSPINKYAETKLLGETLLQKNTDQFYLVRLSRMFGSPGVSQMAKKSFVDVMLDLVAQGKPEIKVVDEERSCPTYSIDLATFVYDLVNRGRPFGIYHGANSGTCTWYEMAKMVFELKGLKPNLVAIKSDDYPRPAKRPMFSELINTKVKKQRGWEEALSEYLA